MIGVEVERGVRVEKHLISSFSKESELGVVVHGRGALGTMTGLREGIFHLFPRPKSL